MSNPKIRIHNTETNEIIDREMTDAEFVIYEAEQEKHTAEKIAKETRAKAKQELLDRLGITAEEATLLLA
jgi:hypothetical protein